MFRKKKTKNTHINFLYHEKEQYLKVVNLIQFHRLFIIIIILLTASIIGGEYQTAEETDIDSFSS